MWAVAHYLRAFSSLLVNGFKASKTWNLSVLNLWQFLVFMLISRIKWGFLSSILVDDVQICRFVYKNLIKSSKDKFFVRLFFFSYYINIGHFLGYIYENGTFGFWGDAEMDGCGRTDFQFGRAVKGAFVDTMLNIGNVEEYSEYQYISACGEPVLLALGSYKALIFADFEECFISVNVLSGNKMGMTKEALQDLADRIHYKILKDVKIPDMR